MYKNYNRPGWMRPVLMAVAGSLLALAPVLSYADGWVATTWGGSTSPNLGTNSRAKPTLGDVNGDGKLDLLVGDRLGVVHVYLNTGTTAAPLWSADQVSLDITIPSADTFAAPRLVDLNGDNLLDLVVGGLNNVYVYQNQGTAGTPSWVENPNWEITGLAANRRYTPGVGNLNPDTDSLPDLMLGSSQGPIIAYRNTGDTSAPGTLWQRETSWDPLLVTKADTVPELADLNADGLADMLVGGQSGTVFAFYNTGTGTAPQWTSIGEWYVTDPDTNNPNYAGPALGDLNGSGLLDLVVGDINGTLLGYINTGLPASPATGTGPPPPPDTTTLTETFDSGIFSCTGAWKPAVGGPNSSYIRNCGDGWTAYAQDVANSATTPPQAAGPVGDQNVVTLDGTVNGPTTPTSTLGAAEMYTAPSDSVRGVLWLMKTYPVLPGVPIPVIQADFRNKTSTATNQYVGIVVFDGTVTNPSGQTSAGVPIRPDVLAADMRTQNCGANTWCPWTTTNIGGSTVIPTAATITVAFRLGDTSTSLTHYGEVDNIKIDGIAASAQSAVPQGDIAQLWANGYQASGTDNMAEAADVAINDSTGDVYVTGQSYESGLNYDIVTLRYDKDGNQVGAVVWDNPVNHDVDIPVKMALDSAGNVYVAGYTYDGSADFDFVVLKYNSALSLQWAAYYNNANGDERPADMVLDSAGNAYVTGSSCSGNACSYATVKFTSAGATDWSQTYGSSGYNQGVGIALDGSGNTYVTGRTSGGTEDDVTTVKYDTAGSELWHTTFAGRTNDRPIGIRTDSAGNSYVVGWNYESSTPDIMILRYNTNGVEQWYKSYDGGQEDIPTAMTTDASGNLYVVAMSGRVADHNMITLKYLPDGSNAWLRTYGNSGFDDVPVDVATAVDADSNTYIYVLGSMTVSSGNTDFVTVKYSDGGTALSAVTYDKYNFTDTPVSLVLGTDSGGYTVPVVVGYSRSNTTQLDEMTVVGYGQAYPDLAMTSLSGPSSAMATGTINLNNTVENIDDLANKKHADSGPFNIGFYLVPDIGGVPDVDAPISIGSRSISNLAPGDSDSDVTSVTIPGSVTEGDYFLMAIADPGGTVVELDKTNNSLVSSAPISVQGAYPDLTVSGLSGPTSAARGDTITLSVSITNLVSIPAGSFRVGIYLSTDTDITTGDILIGQYNVSGLAGFGTDSNTNVSATIPPPSQSLPSGNYYLGVIADDLGQVTEANENNNAEVLRTGTSTSTRLVTDTDFLPGLPGVNVTVVGSGNAAHVQLAQSVGWTTEPSWDTADVGARAVPALVDLNHDGLLDVMIGSSSGSTIAYTNTGTVSGPAWTAAPSNWNIASTDTYLAPAFADLDGDGDQDVMLGGRNGLSAYQNTGDNTNPTWTRNAAWDLAAPLGTNRFYAPTFADLDGDGRIDMMVGTNTGVVLAYQNTGSTSVPAWTAMPSWNGPSFTGYTRPRLVDIDGDGLKDLMVGTQVGNVVAYQNTGTSSGPVWTAMPAWDVPDHDGSTNIAAPAFGDLNGDGSKDMLYGDNTGVAFGYKNAGSFSTPGTYISPAKGAGTHGGYTTLHYVTTVPTGTAITVDVRACTTATPAYPTDPNCTPWVTDIADEGDISALNTTPLGTALPYVQYRLTLSTTVATATPALYSIEAQTDSAPAQDTFLSVVPGAGSGGGELDVLDLLVLGLAGVTVRLIRRRPMRRH